MNTTREQREEFRRRFQSGNGIPVERAHFTKDEGLALLDDIEEAERLREGLRRRISEWRTEPLPDGERCADEAEELLNEGGGHGDE